LETNVFKFRLNGLFGGRRVTEQVRQVDLSMEGYNGAYVKGEDGNPFRSKIRGL
jgi:hypothetical protein